MMDVLSLGRRTTAARAATDNNDINNSWLTHSLTFLPTNLLNDNIYINSNSSNNVYENESNGDIDSN
eukprot:6265004-Amphidinium_carterae.1